MNNNMEKWRSEIEAIDDELLSLLNKRARLLLCRRKGFGTSRLGAGSFMVFVA